MARTPIVAEAAHRRSATWRAPRASRPMTVSRVINGSRQRQGARPASRWRCDHRQLNYAPNPAARSLAGARPIRIGLLYSNPSAAYLSEFLVGVLEQASRSHVQLVVEKCEAGSRRADAWRAALIATASTASPAATAVRFAAACSIMLGASTRTPAVVVASGRPTAPGVGGQHRRLRRGARDDAPPAGAGPPPHRLHHRQSEPDGERAAGSRATAPPWPSRPGSAARH